MPLPLRLPRFSSQAVLLLGPVTCALGLLIALIGEFGSLNGVTDAYRILTFGITTVAAGLLIWGCHGLRRSGARRRFQFMSLAGGGYFLLQLYYRYSDYRWLELTRDMASLDNPLQSDFTPRILVILALFGGSLLLGLLPPVPRRPAAERRAWHLPLHHALPALKKLPVPKHLPRPAFLRRRDRT